MAMLIQYLSAKLGIVTDRSLPELCRERLPRWVTLGLWVQAEVMAMSTDIAEFLGAALGLNLLFGVPLFTAGLITGRDRVRDPRAADARLPRASSWRSPRCSAIVFAGFLYETLRDRSLGARSRCAGCCPVSAGRARCTSRSGSSARP